MTSAEVSVVRNEIGDCGIFFACAAAVIGCGGSEFFNHHPNFFFRSIKLALRGIDLQIGG